MIGLKVIYDDTMINVHFDILEMPKYYLFQRGTFEIIHIIMSG